MTEQLECLVCGEPIGEGAVCGPCEDALPVSTLSEKKRRLRARAAAQAERAGVDEAARAERSDA